jgi:hypothetical protein
VRAALMAWLAGVRVDHRDLTGGPWPGERLDVVSKGVVCRCVIELVRVVILNRRAGPILRGAMGQR